MAQLLLCFKPFRSAEDLSESPSRQRRYRGSPPHSPGRPPGRETRRTVAFVELLKHTNEPLGLALEDGADRDVRVHVVSALRPGGVAEKSGALQLGDRILSINGTATQTLTHNEVNALLENAGNVINLEIAFESLPGADVDDSTTKKIAAIKLQRETPTSYGFTISGGRDDDNRRITVSNVTVGSYAYRQGILKAGDRILKVNGVDVSHASQMETHSLLKGGEGACTLEIEYDVTVHEGLSEATSALLIELLKPKGVSLGLGLRESVVQGAPLLISRIKEAGIADRCGALHVGDRLLSVGGVSLENKNISEVNQMLKKCDLHVQLEIMPGHNYPDEEELLSESMSRLSHHPLSTSQLSGAHSQLSLASTATSTGHLVSHPETMSVTLKADDYGFGLSLQGGATDLVNYPLVVANIEDLGPAAKLGQVQVGDQILAINGVRMDGVTLQQAVKLVQEAGDVINLEVMFNVNDAIVPTSGTFDVTMQRTSTLTLGITINGSHCQGDTIWISNLKKGGIASRMGMLQPGDVLLAVNGESLSNATLRDAAKMLRNAGDIVTLTISKESVPVARKPEAIIFSVELQRNNQSLGITLTGSRDKGGCPTISRIKEDGVAHRTGTLKVGDKILAINGESLFNKTVTEAVRILQAAGEVVTLKISKSTRRTRTRPKANSPTGKGRYKDFGAFHRDMMSRNRIGPRMSPMGGFGRYGRVHRLSQDSFSGWSTPDNHSFVSLDHYGATGLLSQEGQGENESVLDRLTPSEADSSYSRLPPPPPSIVSGVPYSSRVWSYVQDQQMQASSPRSPPSSSGHYPPVHIGSPTHPSPHPPLRSNPYSAPQLLPHDYQHRGLNSHTSNDVATLTNGSTQSELDEEELSTYERRRDAGEYRRASLPVSSGSSSAMPNHLGHEPSKKWDFKYPRSRKSYKQKGSGGSTAMGRMSPFTSSEMNRFTSHSPFPSHLEEGGSPTDPVKKVTAATTITAGVVGGSSRSKRSSSRSPVKPSSPVPIEPTSHHHPHHHHQQVYRHPEHSHGSPSADEVGSKVLSVRDVYDDEDDPDNGAKAASGGSRSGSKMSSSVGSKSDYDHEEGHTAIVPHHQKREGGYTCTSPEPNLPGMSSSSRSSLRLNLSAMQPQLPPYEPPQSQESDFEPSSPLSHAQRSNHHSKNMNDHRKSPSEYNVVPKLEFADDVINQPPHNSDVVDDGSITAAVQSASDSSLLRKKSNSSSNSLSTLQNKSGSDISRKGSTSSNPTHKGSSVVTSSSAATNDGLESPRNRTQMNNLMATYETLNGFKQAISKAMNFEQALKALAESGSSDQDSDSEPHASQGLVLPQHEQQKIMDKMKTSVPPQQLTVRLTKPRTTASFGFSVADGQYDQGVYVKAVKPGGPADGPDGLRPYDRILKVNNREISSEVNCKTILPFFKEGDELLLMVARNLTGGMTPFH